MGPGVNQPRLTLHVIFEIVVVHTFEFSKTSATNDFLETS